jgi:L-ascorbate metabolism protein UlaG (beta-lactamase superfamily)
MYSANYLFCTGHVRWAIDPMTLKHRLPQAPEMDIAHDLDGLSFVLLTHEHADHLDLGMVRALRALPILWVVPEPLLAMVEPTGLSREKIIVPRSMRPLEIEGIKVVPMDGPHWEADPSQPGGLRGVPAIAYLVEFNGKRWLFPSDTRTYDAAQLPSFGPVDGMFAHLWLGRGCALLDAPPLLDAFRQFFVALQPRCIILTHLEEFGRDADDYWDSSHVQ